MSIYVRLYQLTSHELTSVVVNLVLSRSELLRGQQGGRAGTVLSPYANKMRFILNQDLHQEIHPSASTHGYHLLNGLGYMAILESDTPCSDGFTLMKEMEVA